MDAQNGINNGKTIARRKKFDLFRPVSVKPNGEHLQSPNWSVRFQHQGKRTCRSLDTPDYRLAQQRARQMVTSVRQHGWTSATGLSGNQGKLSLADLLDRYQRSALSRGLRPRSIASAQKDLRRVAREIGAWRLADLTPAALQGWIRESRVKPISLRSVLKNAACVFSRPSLQSMEMPGVENPFARLVRPKVDREPFSAPARVWITQLLRQGIDELTGDPRLAFVLALGAGLRWGEIVSLTWEDVRADRVQIAAAKAKGRRARVVPIGELVRRVLDSARGQGPLLSGDAKEAHKTLCVWLKQCGVKDAKPVHYLRKCFGSMAVADHGIFIASKLLGHSNISLTASTYAGQVDQLPAVKF
jgi:integrase